MSIETSNSQGRRVDVVEVIDSAKFFPVPFSIAFMMIIIMLTDGFDLFTMGYVGPHLIEDWGISRADLGPVNSASLIGMAIGSVLLGWLGDRIGRKRAYVSCLALLFVGSMLSFYARDVNELAWWRLVTGFGLGGVTPLATTLISEWTSKHVRSVVVACVIVSIPLGGSIAGLVERQGGTIRYNAEVAQILTQGNRAPGVMLVSGDTVAADLIVSNADPAWTYGKLLAHHARRRWTDRKIAASAYSMSLFVWYFGTNRRYEDVPHHMIMLGPRYRELLDDIFKRLHLAEDFSLYLHRPSASDPSVAPAAHVGF
jgi:MFS family permease